MTNSQAICSQTIIRRIVCGVMCLMSCGADRLSAQSPDPYLWERDIAVGPLDATELVSIELDPHVYAETLDSLEDVRILNADGTPVPYVVRKQRSEKRFHAERTWRAPNVSLQPVQGMGLEIRLTLDDDDPAPDGLRLITPLKNFEQRIQVFGIAADGNESPLVSNQVIFDYSQYMDVRKVDVVLPDTQARSFRVTIDGLTSELQSQLTELTRLMSGGEEVSQQMRTTISQRPFRIDRMELWAEYVETRTTLLDDHPYELVSVNSHVDDETNETIIDIENRGVPLRRFLLETDNKNFRRVATLYRVDGDADDESLEQLASTTLQRFDFRELQEEDLTMTFSETRHDRFRIVIENGGSPPLEIDDVQATGTVDTLIFLAEPQQSYILRYGWESAAAPDLDRAAVEAALREQYVPVSVRLGEPQPRDVSNVAQPVTFAELLNNPYLIGGVVVVMIGVLTWLLYAAAQKVDRLAEQEEAS